MARAFAAEPEIIVCDEITSALDASIQGQVLDALQQMQRQRGVAMLVITHDLAVVWRLAQRVLVLQGGVVHEQGSTVAVFAAPQSAYTRSLLLASTRASRLTDASAEAAAAAALEGRPELARTASNGSP